MRRFLAILFGALALSPPALAASLTPPNLAAASSAANGDLLLIWPTAAVGPLSAITWANLKAQMVTDLGGVSFLKVSNNLSDLANASTARTNLGLGSAAVQNTGTSGANLPFLNGANSWSAVQTINLNAAALPAVTPSSPLQVGCPDAAICNIIEDAFASQGNFTLRRADGTAASMTAVQANDGLGKFTAQGWDGASYIQAAVMQAVAAQNFSVGANGTYWRWFVTPTGSASTTEKMRLLGNGHLETAGTAPSVATGAADCGTSPSVAGNDNTFRATVGTTPGSKCTFTFAAAWTNAPVCSAYNETAGAVLVLSAVTTTGLVANGTLTAADKIGLTCRGFY